MKLAGKYADAVFTHSPSIEETRAFRNQVRASAVAHGRASDDVKVLPGIHPIVGQTRAEAERKYEIVRDLVSLDDALAYLGRFFEHHDFSQQHHDRQQHVKCNVELWLNLS